MISFIFRNWQAKLGSLLVSVVLYINLQNSKLVVKEHFIPIKYPPLSNNLSYSQKSKTAYNVKLEGKEELINLHLPDLKIVIEPEELNPGENELEVKKIEGLPPKGIRATPIDGKIHVTIDNVETKTIPIEVQFDDEPPPNYIKTSFSVDPSTVTISGPAKIIEKWNRYTLGRLSLKEKRETFSVKFRMSNLPKNLQFVSKPKDVTVKVVISKVASDLGEQVVVGMPVSCEGLAEELSAELSPKEVSVKFFYPQTTNLLQINQGLKLTVPCTNRYDYKEGKILPDSKAIAKVKVTKSLILSKLDVITTIPEKVSIKYSIKPEYAVSLAPEKKDKKTEPTEENKDSKSKPTKEDKNKKENKSNKEDKNKNGKESFNPGSEEPEPPKENPLQ